MFCSQLLFMAIDGEFHRGDKVWGGQVGEVQVDGEVHRGDKVWGDRCFLGGGGQVGVQVDGEVSGGGRGHCMGCLCICYAFPMCMHSSDECPTTKCAAPPPHHLSARRRPACKDESATLSTLQGGGGEAEGVDTCGKRNDPLMCINCIALHCPPPQILEDMRRKGEDVPADPFDSNCITPGTGFMDRLGKHLRFFIRRQGGGEGGGLGKHLRFFIRVVSTHPPISYTFLLPPWLSCPLPPSLHRRKKAEDPLWQAPTIIFSGEERGQKQGDGGGAALRVQGAR